jgi:glyoxylase-like metal-dependent hydrolase (beta-lactamase superfamily II)
MNTLATGLSYIDLRFQGVPSVIATVVAHGKGGVALIDPGPASTLATLRGELAQAGITFADVTSVLLTHIHLDHAGASGALVRENPRLRIFVHEKGAPHMIDPGKLLISATRLYGDAMDRLWGEFVPVPASAVVPIRGGERIPAGGRELDVAYTPGHASHHVSYFSAESGVAFVGDTAGIRVVPGGYVLPPTPPPDIDLEAWAESLRRIEQWGAETLFLTHFGPSAPVVAHLREFSEHLEFANTLVRASLRDGPGSPGRGDEDREAWFVDELRLELARRMTETERRAYEAAGRLDLSWRGLSRYWRKKSG